jgi:hypothetical protein
MVRHLIEFVNSYFQGFLLYWQILFYFIFQKYLKDDIISSFLCTFEINWLRCQNIHHNKRHSWDPFKWNIFKWMELCSHSRSNSRKDDTGCRAKCKIRFPAKGFAIMVQFRFWSGHFWTTEWSVDGGFCTTEWSLDGGFCHVIMLWACL